MERISARIAAITESATLAVDAKAKALKAAGENVIGFGAGEPDFPTPGAHRRGGGRGRVADPRNHHYTPTAGLPELRAAIAAQDQARLGLRLSRPRRCSSPTAASTPCTTRSRCCSTRATRCCCPRRTGRPIPRSITLAGGVPVVLPTTEVTGFRVTVEQLEAARHAAHEGAAVRVAEQPDRRGVPARRGRGDRAVGGRARHLGHHRRDLRAPHLRRSRVLVDADARPRARRHVRRAQRRRQDVRDDRVARRLDDRSAPTSSRPRPTCSRTRRRTCRTSRSAAALAAVAGDLDAVAEMRDAFDAARPHDASSCSSGIPGVTCLEPQGAFYCFPSFEGVLGREHRGPHGRTTRSSSAR